MIIGIDQSKRSTALVSLFPDGSIADLELINPGKDLDGEFLIKYQWDHIHDFLKRHQSIRAIALEGLAFGSQDSSYDLLCGIHWHIRTQLFTFYPKIFSGVIAVSSWRSKILSKEEQRMWKANFMGDRVGLKHGVLSKIPENDMRKIDIYMDVNRERINASLGLNNLKGNTKPFQAKKFDIGDAWGIAKYRLSLAPKVPAKTALLRRK